jgi:hypothetical protein
MWDNDRLLARHGVIYPGGENDPSYSDLVNHKVFLFALTGLLGFRLPMSRREARRIVWDTVRNFQQNDSAGQLVFSHEMFYTNISKCDFDFLRELVKNAQIKFVIYARRLDQWAESIYRTFVWSRFQPNQTIHHGKLIPNIAETFHVREVQRMRVANVVKTISEKLPEAQILIRPFSQYQKDGALIASFLDCIGIADVDHFLEAALAERRLNVTRSEPLTFLLWHLGRASLHHTKCLKISKAAIGKIRRQGPVPGFAGRRFRFISETDARRAFDLYIDDVGLFSELAPDLSLTFEEDQAVESLLSAEDGQAILDWLKPDLPKALFDEALASFLTSLKKA